MIGSLRGVLLDRSLSGELLVEVGGVGYRVTASAATAQQAARGPEVFLWIHHHLREDHQSLYGFASRDERDCFEALLGAHGVGPALALAILSVHTPEELARILADDDVTALCLVPGVGKKTAARLLVELRSRLDGLVSASASAAAVGRAPGGAGVDGHAGAAPRTLVRQALAELGYGPDEIRSALDGLDDDPITAGGGGTDIDEATLLRTALRRLAR